jgi:hypothetical protein
MRPGISKGNRASRESGHEILEFALVAMLFVPLLLGTFVLGMNLIKSNQANEVVRDLDDLYIHGADFSTSNYQTLAQRLAYGMNLQFPAFASGTTNIQANTGTTGSVIIWVSQIEWVGATTDPLCTAVGASNCTNHDSFVFTRQILFGNSNLTSQRDTSLGYPTGATVSVAGAVSNSVTDAHAALSGAAQTNMKNLWQTTLNGQQSLADGQVIYVVEGYFQTQTLNTSALAGAGFGSTSQGVYARYFF